jgi:hypothetical protein
MDRGEQHTTAAPDDWAARATKMVEHAVEFVQYRSLRPVRLAVQALVIGTLVALVALFLLVAASIGLVRLLTEDAFGGRVWASDLLVGGIFAAAGAFLFLRSKPQRSGDG